MKFRITRAQGDKLAVDLPGVSYVGARNGCGSHLYEVEIETLTDLVALGIAAGRALVFDADGSWDGSGVPTLTICDDYLE